MAGMTQKRALKALFSLWSLENRMYGIGMRPEACNFMQIKTLKQVFSCDFCEIFNNTFFAE